MTAFFNLLPSIGFSDGAMDKLMSDHANCEMSARVKDILRASMIGHWKSEPCCQHQNFAEHRRGHIKANLEWLMSFLDVDPGCWLLALDCVRNVMNLTAERALGWRTPWRWRQDKPPTSAFHCASCSGTLSAAHATWTNNLVRRRDKRSADDSLGLHGALAMH